jgi:ATP-binding protein involved in chromosome partitioning
MPLKMFQTKDNTRSKGPKYTLAIAAGKGGVGKSTVSVNLALSLKNLGFKVGLIDTDLYGPSVRKMLPEDQGPEQKGQIIEPAICQGIKMISMAYFRKENEASVVRAPIANGIISQFIKQVEWGDLDFLLIDFPPGTGDIQLTISQQANLAGAIMVTTPQEVAVMDVRKAMNMFDIVKIPIIGIIENMSYYFHEKSGDTIHIFGKGGGEKLAKESGVPFLGGIPIDPELCASADLGQHQCSLKTTECYHQLAMNVVEQLKVSAQSSIVNKILQKDPQTMTIHWNDGKSQDFKYSELQKICPCAGCVDENTGKRLSNPDSVDKNLTAKSVDGVGRYAIKIQFNSGCSKGLYSFEMLKECHV